MKYHDGFILNILYLKIRKTSGAIIVLNYSIPNNAMCKTSDRSKLVLA